jgi:hypothetical protein
MQILRDLDELFARLAIAIHNNCIDIGPARRELQRRYPATGGEIIVHKKTPRERGFCSTAGHRLGRSAAHSEEAGATPPHAFLSH